MPGGSSQDCLAGHQEKSKHNWSEQPAPGVQYFAPAPSNQLTPQHSSHDWRLHHSRPKHCQCPECELPRSSQQLNLASITASLKPVLANKGSPAVAKVSAVSMAAKTQISIVKAPEPSQNQGYHKAWSGIMAVGNAHHPVEQNNLSAVTRRFVFLDCMTYRCLTRSDS